MSNLFDRSKVNTSDISSNNPGTGPSGNYGRGNGVKGFFLGMLFTILLGLVGGGAYWLAQRQAMSNRPLAATDSATVNSESANSEPANTATTTATTDAAPANNSASSEPTNTSEPEANSSATSTAGFKDLNLQANHANGSTLRLTGIAVGDGNITLKMAISNGYRQPIRLQGPSDDTILTDNAGNVYNLATPPDNQTISVNSNTTTRGDFVFIGQLAPNTTTLTLTTNSKYGSEESHSTRPKFVIANIPVK